MKKETENILKIADAIEKECLEVESGKRINKKFFKNAINSLKSYMHIDKLSQKKVNCNVNQKLLYETEGDNFYQCVEDALDEDNKTKVIETAWRYAQMVREQTMAK